MPAIKDPELDVEQTISDDDKSGLTDGARKAYLFSVGLLAATIDEIEDLVGRLIERGELVEKDSRRMLGEVVDRRKGDAKAAESKVTKRVATVTNRLAPATKADIDVLNEKITRLSEQLEELHPSD